MTSDRVAFLRESLAQAFSPLELVVHDDSAAHAGHAGAREGGHYRVEIVSAAFAGRAPVQRHRLVYAALGDLRARGIHALAIVARAPGEPVR
jgi:BolA protein